MIFFKKNKPAKKKKTKAPASREALSVRIQTIEGWRRQILKKTK